MADRTTLLRNASDAADVELKRAGNDITKLSEPHLTVAIIHASKGIIDNGGLVYFFESDWPGTPPYSIFSDAYRRIGKTDAADDIDRAVDSFGFDHPERRRQLRQDFMDTQFGGEDDDGEETEGLWEVQWTDRICGDDTVWDALAEWIQQHTTQ